MDLILNPEIVAWWFCDDGTNTWKNRNATIYSQGFSEIENQILVDKLNGIGIKAIVGKTYDNTGSGFCIDFYKDAYFDLIECISPFVSWECMKYKIDLHGAKKGLRRSNKSGISGVYWDKNRQKWAATIKLNGKTKALGRYLNFQEAIDARKQAEHEYYK